MDFSREEGDKISLWNVKYFKIGDRDQNICHTQEEYLRGEVLCIRSNYTQYKLEKEKGGYEYVNTSMVHGLIPGREEYFALHFYGDVELDNEDFIFPPSKKIYECIDDECM